MIRGTRTYPQSYRICARCRFWEASDWKGFDGLPKGTRGPHCNGDLSPCRKSPPVATPDDDNGTRSNARWPLTKQRDWCGAWEFGR